jgi:ABC-type antimicrobial peptide transport system permease subunit
MSGIALLLSLMGVYSLMAFLVTRRTQEIGVRIALGASRWQVIRLTGAQAVVITGTGVTLGTAMALGVGRLMESVLFGLVAPDLATMAALIAALTVVALAAGVIPARRAANLDPTVALRAD